MSINNLDIKREVFDIFDISKDLWNDFYNGKEVYTSDDIEDIKKLLEELKTSIQDLENVIC